MAMFGALAKKRGPFDFSPEIRTTPGIGDGLPGATPMGEPGLGFAAPAAAPSSKLGARDIIGIIGEALGGAAGNGPGAYTQMKLREREMQRQQQLYQQQRRDGLADYATKQMIEARYAKPSALPEVVRLQQIADDPAQPANIRKAAADAVEARNNPIVNANVGGRDFFGPRSLLLESFSKGGDPRSGGVGGGSAPAPSSGGFMTLGQFDAMRSVPTFKSGHPAWDTPVQISNDADFDKLPSGKTYIGPDNVVRRK